MRFLVSFELQLFLNFSFFLYWSLIPYSPERRQQDVTSQLSSPPTNENAAYQWTGTENVTQGQTQYGYSYHHIDHRTENQCAQTACMDDHGSEFQYIAESQYGDDSNSMFAYELQSSQYLSWWPESEWDLRVWRTAFLPIKCPPWEGRSCAVYARGKYLLSPIKVSFRSYWLNVAPQ